MAEAAWAEETGDLETLVALSLPATRADAGRVYLTLRDSLYARVALMFADPRCDAETRAVVREHLSGGKNAASQVSNPPAPTR
ncbi:MAG: hypothetical protein HMLKMBBP_01114 [Planctomycetes bacterium]|nr:hypothetical protein [Planctomycetota bacterium]